MADDKKDITRRQAIKTITVGAGVIASLPVLTGRGKATDPATHPEHMHHGDSLAQDQSAAPYKFKFFSDEENQTLIQMSELIIPADDHSAGAKEARVSEYIDTVVSASPRAVKQGWRDGIASIDKKSRDMFSKKFVEASQDQQISLLTELSKHELGPQTEEERFFKTMKFATIDGYYTSKIGIHDELNYKGNTYLMEFVGCTHPEHQS
ncbi:MAG TPA: gluconate 2-dehydrogenase subunit 3 family protein [Blastocatellia bacterium]